MNDYGQSIYRASVFACVFSEVLRIECCYYMIGYRVMSFFVHTSHILKDPPNICPRSISSPELSPQKMLTNLSKPRAYNRDLTVCEEQNNDCCQEI